MPCSAFSKDTHTVSMGLCLKLYQNWNDPFFFFSMGCLHYIYEELIWSLIHCMHFFLCFRCAAFRIIVSFATIIAPFFFFFFTACSAISVLTCSRELCDALHKSTALSKVRSFSQQSLSQSIVCNFTNYAVLY